MQQAGEGRYNALHQVRTATLLFLSRTPPVPRGAGRGNRRVVEPAKVTLSPRVARLLRGSRWLVVLAVLAFLPLVLASYTRTDPGWSFSVTGAPLGTRGGLVGAWPSD